MWCNNTFSAEVPQQIIICWLKNVKNAVLVAIDLWEPRMSFPSSAMFAHVQNYSLQILKHEHWYFTKFLIPAMNSYCSKGLTSSFAPNQGSSFWHQLDAKAFKQVVICDSLSQGSPFLQASSTGVSCSNECCWKKGSIMCAQEALLASHVLSLHSLKLDVNTTGGCTALFYCQPHIKR